MGQARLVETRARSVAKAISYRLLGSTCTGLIFFTLTGKITLSMGAGAIDMVVKILAYFVHERIWNAIDYGRAKPPEYEI